MAPNENLSQRRFALNNGSGEIPALGFGTSLSDNAKTRNAVKTAVEVGFRHLDAAERYRNEAEVGAALKELFDDYAAAPHREDFAVALKAGAALLWVRCNDPDIELRALRILEEAGGKHVHIHGRSPRPEERPQGAG